MPAPQDDNCDDVNGHRDDDGGINNDDHCRAVETNAGESDRANCYLVPFDNTTIRYVVAACVLD